MSRLGAVTSGSAAETRTFGVPRYREQLVAVAYTGNPVEVDDLANAAAGIWVPEGTPRRRLKALAPRLDALLAAGGTVLLFGDHQSGWPLTADWAYRPAGGAGLTHIPDCCTWAGTEVGAAAAELHHHGVLIPPDGAEVLLAAPDGAAVAYLDRRSTSGTLLVSTVDPLAHFGHTGDPGAAVFLDALLPWVTATLLPLGARS